MTVASLDRPQGRPVPRRHRGPRLDEAGVVVGLALTPLLVPAGPGNSGLADLGVAAGVAGWLVTSRAVGRSIEIPYLLPVTLLVSGGALAIMSGGAGGDALVLVQDVVLLLWAAAIAALVMDDRGLRLVLRVWVTVGVASAAVTLVGLFTGIAALAGTSAADGSRASATLGDPNLAASWFVLCLLVLRAARLPRRSVPRWLCCLLLLGALGVTGSNGGMMALLLATVLGWVLGVAHRHGPLVAAGLACALMLFSAYLVTAAPVDAARGRVVSQVSLLNDSLGRTDKSEESRSLLLDEAIDLARSEGLVGVGPGGTRATLQAAQAPYVKEAHNDYLAVVVERGLLGGLGLVLLLTTACLHLWVMTQPGRRAAVRHALPRPELLGCALVAVAVSAAFYEVLHFRHVWVLLGLVAGVSAWRPTAVR